MDVMNVEVFVRFYDDSDTAEALLPDKDVRL